MSKTDWVNENINRLYPFEETGEVTLETVILPRELLADAGFILGIRTESDADALLWLYQVTKSGSSWSLVFRWNSTEGVSSDYEFVFNIAGTDSEGDTVFADAQDMAASPDPEYGTAFIVLGDVEAASVMPNGTYQAVLPTTSIVLPGLIQTLKNHFVRRINLANDPGPTFLACGSDPQPVIPGECKAATVMKRDLSGDVRIRVGYNSQTSVLQIGGRLVFGSAIGAGEGVPCVEVSRDPEGGLPDAPTCEKLVYMINGVGPDDDGYFQIVAGRGFKLETSSGTLTLTPDSQAFCTPLWDDEDE